MTTSLELRFGADAKSKEKTDTHKTMNDKEIIKKLIASIEFLMDYYVVDATDDTDSIREFIEEIKNDEPHLFG